MPLFAPFGTALFLFLVRVGHLGGQPEQKGLLVSPHERAIHEKGALQVGWHSELLGEQGRDYPLVDLLEV